MPRNPPWTRDELILALDLYFDLDFARTRTTTDPRIEELSDLLNTFSIHPFHERGPDFRNPSSVQMKMSNFLRFDREYLGSGLQRGAKGDESVWNEFAADIQRLKSVASLIRENGPANRTDLPKSYSFEEDFPEGALLTRLHKIRERNPNLVKKKKAQVLADTGKLACEGCGFDFRETYGHIGTGFIECHHIIPIATVGPGSKTKLSDLILLCSNCHRMIHRLSPAMTLPKLRSFLNPPASKA